MSPLIQHTIDHLFRHESGKMIAVLSRMLGLQQMHLAEDIVQDTLLKAMNTWAYNGIPDKPAAWLYRVAHNRAVDLLRKENAYRLHQPRLEYLLQQESGSHQVEELFDTDQIMDSQLKMMFVCCHPAIPVDSQISLILKTLCGLSNKEIARAFLKDEDTIAKRNYRAREKIRTESISLELPPPSRMKEFLHSVLHSLYLLFNEGYHSTHPEKLIREELCEEAMRLTFLLTKHPATNSSQTYALLALFCFQASRFNARLDDKGNIILLKYQDRKLWYKPLINQGNLFLQQASQEETSVYHLQAAIAWLHATAPDFRQTNWKAIYHLYCALAELQSSDIILLNKAIAASYAIDRSAGLEELQNIKGLHNNHLYHAAYGEIYFDEGRFDEAKKCYEQALARATTAAEQQLLRNKIAGCAQT